MKTSLTSYVGWLLLLSALGFYGYGIFEAIRLSWPLTPSAEPIVFSEVLSTTLSSVQALLLTNLGMLLGISVADRNSSIARQLMLGSNPQPGTERVVPPTEIKDKIQLFALAVYVLSLVACLVTWIHNGFSTKSTDVIPVIAESGKMFIGVVLAYITVIIGK